MTRWQAIARGNADPLEPLDPARWPDRRVGPSGLERGGFSAIGFSRWRKSGRGPMSSSGPPEFGCHRQDGCIVPVTPASIGARPGGADHRSHVGAMRPVRDSDRIPVDRRYGDGDPHIVARGPCLGDSRPNASGPLVPPYGPALPGGSPACAGTHADRRSNEYACTPTRRRIPLWHASRRAPRAPHGGLPPPLQMHLLA
jgi:hypothetical protein